VPDVQADVIAWLPLVIVAATQIIVRLIGVAAAIWQERARANANCAQMRAAAGGGVALFERRQDGSGLVIVPQGQMSREKEETAPRAGPERAPSGR
jgi:hypothetical protein